LSQVCVKSQGTGAVALAGRQDAAPGLPADANVPVHVLVPVCLDPSERGALMEALELVAGYRRGAKVTLLHVIESKPDPIHDPFDWLSPLRRLQHELARRSRLESALKAARRSIETLVNGDLPRQLHGLLEIRSECRVGEPATEVVRFANEQSVELVVLCFHRSERGWSHWPLQSDRIATMIQAPVVLVGAASTSSPVTTSL